jgi:hypothetical protein
LEGILIDDTYMRSELFIAKAALSAIVLALVIGTKAFPDLLCLVFFKRILPSRRLSVFMSYIVARCFAIIYQSGLELVTHLINAMAC